MPLFTPVNDVDANNSSQAVEELDMREMNEDAVEHAMAALTEPLGSVPKE
jgi:hypothetical protein